MNRVTLLGSLVMAATVAHASQSLKPPLAKKVPKEIIVHGDKRVDDYFWLREKTNSDVIAYLKAENAYADQIMAPIASLQVTLYREMLGHLKETDRTAPLQRGDYFYYNRTEEGKNYSIYCRKFKSLEAPEEIILDVNQLAQGHQYFNVGIALPSDDNNFLTYTSDTTGYRQYTLQIKDLRTGQLLPEKFERVTDLVWAPDNKTLFFVTEDPVTKRSDTVFRHTLGTTTAPKIYFDPDELFDVSINRSLDRKYLFASSESKLSTEVRFIPLDHVDAEFKVIQPREPEHKYFASHRDGLFYFRTNDKAKNYRIATAPVASPGKENWKEYIHHNLDVKIEDIAVFQDYDAISERFNGLDRIRIRDLKARLTHTIDLPEPAYDLSVDDNVDSATNILRINYQSLVTPFSVFNYNMETRQRKKLKQVEVPKYDPAIYQSERLFATASDGASIPLSIVYRKGMKKDGHNPLFLYAYGSYGISIPPTFSYQRLALLDRGAIFVIAHIRGGGEMGEVWRDQGRMKQKMNTFTDFITCAEYLIREKYTSREKLVTAGGSAGGLLMGAVLNMRPDLFKAAIAYVPFVDVLNTMLDPTLPLTTSEYIEWGNPNNKEDYDYIKKYSPYDNVRAQEYPALLVRTSLNDSQVPYWEAAKWVAKLRTMKTDSSILLLKTNMGAGHGGASGRYDALHDTAYDYAFFLTQLGIDK